MQPYLFPYFGYYQLVSFSDIFVLYDDVTYIKQGYINRNQITCNGQSRRFTVPVPGASSNRLIRDLEFSTNTTKVIKTIEQAYSKAPYFPEVFPIISRVLTSKRRQIAYVCYEGLREVFEYLGMNKNLVFASQLDYDRSSSAEDKLIQICRSLGAENYVNSIGGLELYSKVSFASKGCRLSFLRTKPITYEQDGKEFIPNLSIIDPLMRLPRNQIRGLLDCYELV
jgi:hypothetical protein